jgi:hypothetical protein
MAESPEHQYLSESFLSVLDSFSRSELYSYRESDRGKFDFACLLSETWEYLVNGQTLWKHSEGIDKDLRTLLVSSDAPVVAYIARDTTRHRSVFYEAVHDYHRDSGGRHPKHLKVFWVPADFDADSAEARDLIRMQLQAEVVEDVLFNVVFGRLSAPRVRAIVLGSGLVGVELAVLHSIATEGFFNFSQLRLRVDASATVLRDRVQRLLMSGLLLQPRDLGQMYVVGSAGRAFLRLCAQVYKLRFKNCSLSPETADILRMLEIDQDPHIVLPGYGALPDRWVQDRTPRAIFVRLFNKTWAAAQDWGVNWEQDNFVHDSGEQDLNRWLML